MENLKPFNQEEFDAGCPAITRDGRKVKQAYTFDADTDYPLQFVLEGESGELHSATKSGKYDVDVDESKMDLFMTPKMKTWHYCICRDKDTRQPWISGLHASKEIMENIVNVIDNEIIQTFEVEIEHEEPKTV